MAEVVNLRRARKAKARDEKSREAEANRIKHGIAKPVREMAKARAEKQAGAIEAHRLDDKK